MRQGYVKNLEVRNKGDEGACTDCAGKQGLDQRGQYDGRACGSGQAGSHARNGSQGLAEYGMSDNLARRSGAKHCHFDDRLRRRMAQVLGNVTPAERSMALTQQGPC